MGNYTLNADLSIVHGGCEYIVRNLKPLTTWKAFNGQWTVYKAANGVLLLHNRSSVSQYMEVPYEEKIRNYLKDRPLEYSQVFGELNRIEYPPEEEDVKTIKFGRED